MALNVTQVNQAFLGLLGRPATGAEAGKFAGSLDTAALAQTILSDASFKDQLSVEALSFKTVDVLNADPAAFVESLYTALLGRASDAEGKAFWLSVAGANPNRADVVSQFIAAIQAQEGTADANAFASIQAEDKALANAWVESLYNNLAGRASDAEGLDFWSNAIVNFAMTPAQVAASFAAVLAAQGATTEDGQNYLAKQGVADAFSASFRDFNPLITANEKAEQLKNLVTMMNGVNKDSQVDQYAEEITKIGNEYQNIAAVQFTTSDEDDLGIDPETGESNLKGAANFTGTYNLTDAEKGTIQSSDSATGTEAYLTDTLTVNVIGYDKTTHDTFDINELPNTTSVEKLVINNGAANVTGAVAGDFQYINVNGTGEFNITASTNNTDGLKDISLNSASGKDNSFTTTDSLTSIKTGAGNDTVTVSTVSKSLSTGAGDDAVVASLAAKATADLGAGDDTFTGSLGAGASLNGGAGDDVLTVVNVGRTTDKKGNIIAAATIDGGTGSDTLDLSVSGTEFRGIETIRGIDSLKVGDGTKLYASAISGQKMELSGTNLVLDARTTSNVDLSKLSNAEGEDVEVRIENVKSGTITLETGTKNFNAIKETIVLAKDASKVSIKGLEKGNDKIEIAGTKVDSATDFFIKTAEEITGINNGDIKANNIYFIDLKDKVAIKTINDLLGSDTFTNLNEKDVFYLVATDEAAGKNSNAKVYKIEVGKNGQAAKLDQVGAINVADKGVLTADDFVPKADDYVVTDVVSGTETINLADAEHSGESVEVNALKLPESDTLTISGGTATQAATVDTAAGKTAQITVNDSLKSLTTTAGNDKLDLSGGNAGAVSTGNGSDEITVTTSGATSIDGGAGNDTLKLGGVNTTITSLSSIETIDVTTAAAGLKASAISGLTTTVSGNQEFTVDATDATSIDLSNVTFTTTGDVKVDEVGADAVVTLNADDGKAETISLANLTAGSSVTIKGAAAGTSAADQDKIDLQNVNLLKTAAGTASTFEAATGAMDENKAYLSTVSKTVDKISAADLGVTAATSAKGTSLVAVQGTDGVKFYGIETVATSGGVGFELKTTAIDVTLLGVTGLGTDNFGIA